MARSGYVASLYIGTYIGAELTNVAVTINHEPIEVSDLADTWKARTAGPLSWELTGTKNYATAEFLAKAGCASGACSVLCNVWPEGYSLSATALFTAYGYITRGGATFPMGAATEEITIVGATTTGVSGSQVWVRSW